MGEKLGVHGVDVLNFARSNHLSILLCTREEAGARPRQRHLFRFEAKWCKLEESEHIIRKAWDVYKEALNHWDQVK